jgi:hypothetical protein
MVEPFSLGALGALAATEGIKFVYGQAAEVMKRWHARRAGKQAEADAPIPIDEAQAAALLEGTLRSPKVDFDAMERLEADIPLLAGVLGNYANGFTEPDRDDPDLAAAADGLRRALEAVYGQRMTFKGEQREPSGVTVVGRAHADEVAGQLAGVRAALVRSGRIEGTATAGTVTPTGEVDGVRLGTVGG